MITVTLGTIPYPFNRVIDWIGILIEKGIISEPVVIQHGVTEISALKKYPQVTTFSIVSLSNMVTLVEKSRLVISHAGQGSTRSLAAKKASFILVPRLARYGEHIDDHQLLFAQCVESLGVKHCLSLETLEEAIKKPPSPLPCALFDSPKLVEHLVKCYPAEKPKNTNILEKEKKDLYFIH
ncbi:glycosyl transferase [Phormidium sp. LEGE 05292]|uniref:glycosyltransferase n=1 Tax=[Phormidium] sp. LEGE 05292 TaxID=767427 RepID=UPI00187EB7DC|nr:glycosyltransferase [Phormidium sp. LEGE 05292]MBE9226059.1 glycosyl transferase [Phormidium sp. LEGE 05292]